MDGPFPEAENTRAISFYFILSYVLYLILNIMHLLIPTSHPQSISGVTKAVSMPDNECCC